MPVTITACGNSTPASGTVIATTQAGGQEYQHFILTDSAGSALGQVVASPFYARVNMAASIALTNPTGSVLVTNIPASIALTNPTGSVLINNPTGSVLVTNMAASIALTNPTGSVLINNPTGSMLVTNLTGSAAGSPLFVSACLTNMAGSAAGSPLFVSITNTVSASIGSGSVALLAGANIIGGVRVVDGGGLAYGVSAASPLYISGGAAGGTSIADNGTFAEGTTNLTPVGGIFLETAVALTASQSGVVRMTASRAFHVNLRDGAGLQLGPSVASPLFVSVGNRSGSAAGSPLFASITNMAGSAAGSPLFTSITNSTGSMLVTNMAASIVVSNLTGSAAGSPIFASVTNQVSASISNNLSASIIGFSGCPLPIISNNGQIWVSGSYLTVNNVQFSASGAAASTVLVAGVGGQQMRFLSITFTVSASIAVSFRSGSTGGVDLIQPMYFGTNGGMDVNRMPHGYIAQWASGCAPTIFLSAAASCRGFADYVNVPG